MSLEAERNVASTMAKRGGADSEGPVAEESGLWQGSPRWPPCLHTTPSQSGPHYQADLF